VSIGDDAYTGAGSVITSDVPDGALGVARARQSNIDGYADRRRERAEAERAEAERSDVDRAETDRADAER
jgi:serine acetyltransferase